MTENKPRKKKSPEKLKNHDVGTALTDNQYEAVLRYMLDNKLTTVSAAVRQLLVCALAERDYL